MSNAEHQRWDDEIVRERYLDGLKKELKDIDPEITVTYFPVYGKYLVFKKYNFVFGHDHWFNTWEQGAKAVIQHHKDGLL